MTKLAKEEEKKPVEGEKLPEKDAVHVMTQLLKAVEYCHTNKITHG